MSHNKLRKENNCLNCGTTVAGRYCQNCGQENAEPDLTVKGLIRHFLYDITHFDGKYFETVKTLFTRPGYLSTEYIRGRKAHYLDPARMYLFTSAIFFFLYYSFFFHVTENDIRESYSTSQKIASRLTTLDSNANYNVNFNEKLIIRNGTDTLLRYSDATVIEKFLDSIDLVLAQRKDSLRVTKGEDEIFLFGPDYKTINAYDSAQQLLPESKKDGWLKKTINHRQIKVSQKYHGDRGDYIADLINRFTHSYPTIMFIMLPVLALLLRLIYRSRKQTNTAHHGIFLVHLFIFVFLTLILYFLIEKIETVQHWSWMRWLRYICAIGIFFYIYKAMRRFYMQGRFKTLLHYIPFLLGSVLIMLLVFAIYFTYVILNG